MSCRQIPGFLTVLCSLLLICATASAQNSNGSIVGAVKDASGAVLPVRHHVSATRHPGDAGDEQAVGIEEIVRIVGSPPTHSMGPDSARPPGAKAHPPISPSSEIAVASPAVWPGGNDSACATPLLQRKGSSSEGPRVAVAKPTT